MWCFFCFLITIDFYKKIDYHSHANKNYDVPQLKNIYIMEIVALCLGVITTIVVIAFCVAWACIQEEQFEETDKQNKEIKEKSK